MTKLKLKIDLFKSSNKSISYKFFNIFFSVYIKMPKNLLANIIKKIKKDYKDPKVSSL